MTLSSAIHYPNNAESYGKPSHTLVFPPSPVRDIQHTLISSPFFSNSSHAISFIPLNLSKNRKCNTSYSPLFPALVFHDPSS